MVKKAKKAKKEEKPQCSGFGLAYDEDDEECQDCDMKDECEEKTNDDGGELDSPEDIEESDEPDTESDEPDSDDETLDAESVIEDDISLEELAMVVKDLFIRVGKLENNAGTDPNSDDGIKAARAAKKADKVSSVKEKELRKEDLLSKVPYSNDELNELGGRDVKMLASALNINSFGISKIDAIKLIISSQKKASKTKSTKVTKKTKKTSKGKTKAKK